MPGLQPSVSSTGPTQGDALACVERAPPALSMQRPSALPWAAICRAFWRFAGGMHEAHRNVRSWRLGRSRCFRGVPLVARIR